MRHFIVLWNSGHYWRVEANTESEACEIASRGGNAVVAKYGREHMRDLANRWHDKYKLVPYDGNDFLIVNRQTGKVNAKTLNGARYAGI